MSKLIALTGRFGRGLMAIVDDIDYDDLIKYRWYGHKSQRGNVYAINRNSIDGRKTTLRMHRVILKLPPAVFDREKREVDHIDGNTLNNKKENLRIVTHQQNCWNSKKIKDSISPYKGVCFDCRRSLWYSRIRFNGKNKFLGYFKTEKEAAHAYDKYAIEIFGENAKLNFPNFNYL